MEGTFPWVLSWLCRRLRMCDHINSAWPSCAGMHKKYKWKLLSKQSRHTTRCSCVLHEYEIGVILTAIVIASSLLLWDVADDCLQDASGADYDSDDTAHHRERSLLLWQRRHWCYDGIKFLKTHICHIWPTTTHLPDRKHEYPFFSTCC